MALTADEKERYKRIKLTRLFVQASMLNHTRYFFKTMYNRKFEVNTHHELISHALSRVLSGEVKKLMINIAPRYGKTELAVKNFISHGLALNPASKYIHLSYSDDLALDNSDGVRSIVRHPSFRELFPDVRVVSKSDAKKKWYTTENGGVYATSAAGQVTGFGAGTVDSSEEAYEAEHAAMLDRMLAEAGINKKFGGALIIDDPIKPEDADSEAKRERINARYDSTIKNRVNSRNTPIIIIMQRLHDRDLCGYLLENEPGEWEVLSLPCIQTRQDAEGNDEEYALWDFKHTLPELKKLQAENPLVFGRQYQQNPMPAGGLMYGQPWKLYAGEEFLPLFKTKIRKAYVDTADLGTDYLCAISYIESPTAMYVTDVVYTQAGMELTEPMTSKMALRNNLDVVRVESNNGGRGFARNVEALVRMDKNFRMRFTWFHQTDNKYVRIFSRAAEVQNLIHFPVDWALRWPKFHKHVTAYMQAGDNAHDDAPDALTGMAEYFGKDKAVASQVLAKLPTLR